MAEGIVEVKQAAGVEEETPVNEQDWLSCADPGMMLEFLKEQDWLARADATNMLEFLRGKITSRRFRLFASCCCQRIQHLPKYELYRSAIEVSERFADGKATEQELESARQAIGHKWASSAGETLRAAILACHGELLYREHGQMTARDVADAAARAISMRAKKLHRQSEELAEKRAQACLLRDIFGNPFHPVIINPIWRTTNVIGIAQTIYSERRFDDMPILGDALEDAGCDNKDILEHCRSGGEHVRGCWVVDLILGKS
jgi:hypothetical protein